MLAVAWPFGDPSRFTATGGNETIHRATTMSVRPASHHLTSVTTGWFRTGSTEQKVTRKLHATDVPADTRLACQARDMGSRDPGGRTPLGLSDLHHLAPHDHARDGVGGHQRVHDPDRMVHLSPRGHHRIIHRHGWTGALDVSVGRLTWTRAGRTITTLPWHTTLRTVDHPAR